MRRDGQALFIPFPRQLMSTARSPATMGSTFGREITNMYATADGAGSKRNGVVAVGGEITGETITALMSYVKTGVGEQVLAVTDAGKIYLQNGSSWTLTQSGLSTTGTPRSVNFAGKLVMVNGVDAMLAWNGTSWSMVSEKITDTATGLTYVNGTTFSIQSTASLYPVGSDVRATLSTGNVVSTVASVSTSGSVVTVVLGTSILNNTLSAVAFTAKPPVMAFIYAAHDRLWGFGLGPLSAAMSSDANRSRVYYTDGVNSVTAWHDATGAVPHINLADKNPAADDVLAMAVKDGMTVFLLRNSTQVWTGSLPGVAGDFAWQKTMPVGVIHGSAVVELPNDIAFISRTGARTLSRALQTEQLDVSDVGSEIDPTITAAVAAVLADATAYRALKTVLCAQQGWFGVKLKEQVLVFQIGSAGKGWVVFDGLFAQASAFGTGADGTLYLASGGQVYRYDTNAWSDAGNPIRTVWWTPWLRLAAQGKRWANRYVEVITEPGVSVDLTLRRYRDLDDGNPRSVGVTSAVVPDYWDSAEWDASMFDQADQTAAVVRDPFVCDEAAWALESQTTTGPLTVLGLKVFGVGEK